MEKSLPVPLTDTLNALQVFPKLNGYETRQQDEGFANHVAILHNGGKERYVVKTPREDGGKGPEYVLAEALVVGHLQEAALSNPAPVDLPEVIESQYQGVPYYSVFSYVPGSMIRKAELAAVPNDNKIKIGEQLAEAIYWIEQQDTATAVPEILRTTQQHIIRLNFLKKFTSYYDDLSEAGHNDIADAVVITQSRAAELFTPEYLSGNAAGHSDLFYGNITFDVTPQEISLRGIYDFGSMSVRPTESELRHFDFLSAHYTEGFIAKYQELSGIELDVERIALWSMVQTLGPLLYRITQDVPFSDEWAWSHKHFSQEFYPRFCATLGV